MAAGGGAAGGGMAGGGGGGGGMGAAVDSDVRASFYDPVAETWSPVEIVAPNLSAMDMEGALVGPVVAGLSADLDASGRAIVLYEQNTIDDNLDGDGDPLVTTVDEDEVLFSRYDPLTSTWSSPVEIDNLTFDAEGVTVAIEETSGDAILLWTQSPDGMANDLRAIALAEGEDPTTVTPDDFDGFGFGASPGAGDVSLIIESSGNAFIVAEDMGAMGMAAGDPDATSEVRAFMFDASAGEFSGGTLIGLGVAGTTGNSDPVVASDFDETVVDDVRLTFDAAGNPVAVWVVEDFDADDPVTPTAAVLVNSTIVTNTFVDGMWGNPATPTDETALEIVVNETVESTDLGIASGTGAGEILVRLRDNGSDVDDVFGIRNGDSVAGGGNGGANGGGNGGGAGTTTLESSSPAGGDDGVDVLNDIVLTFTDDVDLATAIIPGSITITQNGTPLAMGMIAQADSAAELVINAPMAMAGTGDPDGFFPDADIEVTINPDGSDPLVDSSGMAVEPTSFSFMTGPLPPE